MQGVVPDPAIANTVATPGVGGSCNAWMRASTSLHSWLSQSRWGQFPAFSARWYAAAYQSASSSSLFISSFIEMAAQETARFRGWRFALQFSFLCFTFVVLYWFFTFQPTEAKVFPSATRHNRIVLSQLVDLCSSSISSTSLAPF
jgi:hypothetical protein